MIDKLQSHYGFTKTPFGRALAPQMLHRHGAHAEAVARIGWCVTERALGVITGEVGAGKTVAVRAALAELDQARSTIIYLGNPAVGARGLYHGIVTALGGVPRFHKAALIPQTTDLLAAEEHERGRHVTIVIDEAHLLATDQLGCNGTCRCLLFFPARTCTTPLSRSRSAQSSPSASPGRTPVTASSPISVS